MISFQKRFLFVHIPKTAGNSIQSVLAPYAEDMVVRWRPRQDGIERFGLHHPEYSLTKHSTLAEYQTALGQEKFDQLYKFACVRNPWDRMISYYFGTGEEPAGWDRDAFARLVERTLPATEYLRLGGNEKDPFGNVDRIIRFESLPEDFAAVCARLDIPAATLPQYNRSERDSYARYYDKELRALVAERFAAEIERFGYAFEGG